MIYQTNIIKKYITKFIIFDDNISPQKLIIHIFGQSIFYLSGKYKALKKSEPELLLIDIQAFQWCTTSCTLERQLHQYELMEHF